MKRPALVVTLLAALIPTLALAMPQAGKPAPDFTLPTIDGKTLALASLRGKPVYLNFFASWCGPCNEEAPSIGKLSDKYKAKGLNVIGVDELESVDRGRGFLQKYHLSYVAVVDGDGKMGHDYGTIGLPLHVFIDRAGNVKLLRNGEMTPAEIESAIKSIL
jgi:cytochrome c biogenesis protein CcmG, thiol:disulfide interchange protein DsbE